MNLNHLVVFLAVAETQSFTRAATRLKMDKGQVSRVVRALEEQLSTVLFHRTTRSVTPTPEGEQLLARVAGPLAALDAASSGLVDRAPLPSGTVTLTTTPDLGRTLVAPAIAAFRARFPLVRVRLHLEPSLVSLQKTGADLALRVGKPGTAVKVRRLGELHAAFFASPRYLAARGTPHALAELRTHDGLWPRVSPRKAFSTGQAPPEPTVDCDDFGALLELARASAGVAVLPLFLAARDVEQGALVRVLPETTLPGAPLYLVTTPERPLPPRVSALRDFLVDRLA